MAKKFDREELIELVVCDILNGVSRYRIILKMTKDAYEGIKTSSFCRSKMYKLVKDAYDRCKPSIEKDKQKMRELMVARLEDIIEEARDQRDRQNAIKAAQEINKLMGLYEPDKVDITADVNVDINFGLEEEDETQLQD